MSGFYLLKEDGGKILLENLSGALLLEPVAIPGPTVDWQAGGAGYPVGKKKRRNETEELFKEIEHALEVALGIAEEPAEISASAEIKERPQAWSDERYHSALRELGRRSAELEASSRSLEKLHAMFRAYEEAQARERALQDDEEAWFLLT